MVFKVPNGDKLILKILSAGIFVAKYSPEMCKISKIHVTCANSFFLKGKNMLKHEVFWKGASAQKYGAESP